MAACADSPVASRDVGASRVLTPEQLWVYDINLLGGQQFIDYVLGDAAQQRFADWGYRPVDEAVLERALFDLKAIAHAQRLKVSAQRRARADTFRALRLMQLSIQQAVDAVFLVSAEARILDVNEAACAMLGYTREELLSKTVHDIDTNFTRENWRARWQHLKVRKSFSYESRHQKKDGTVIQTDTTINFLVHEGREYYCAFMRDITNRKRAEASLPISSLITRSVTI